MAVLLGLASIGIRTGGALGRLALFLVGVVFLLAVSGRTVPLALVIFIELLILASSVIGVRDAVETARSGSEGGRTHSQQR